MVRLGIGLYGVSNDAEEQKQLENVGTLNQYCKELSRREKVWVMAAALAKKNQQIATIPMGYADGISRGWGMGCDDKRLKLI
jgi:alanine racemase